MFYKTLYLKILESPAREDDSKFARMTFEACERQLKDKLASLYDAGECAAMADQLLEESTGCKRLARRMNAQHEIPQEKLSFIQTATAQLLQGKPLQYVLGYTDFYRLRFQVNEATLIPRPETEELVAWIINDYKTAGRDLRLLDIGTGSGCIPVALKKNLPAFSITSLDVSSAALETARQNAEFNRTAIHFLQFNFLEEESWQQLGNYDVIASNPPYIPLHEKMKMDKHVTDWEPATALFVPDETPLLFYKKIASFGQAHLQPGGAVYLETHKDYATSVQQLFVQHGYIAEVRKDLHGNDRMVKALNSE